MHLLDIDIDDTNLNPRAFKIMDNSIFDDSLPVYNLILEITPPGFHGPVVFKVNKGFTKVLNANLLRLNSLPLKELPSLPDGVYSIKYSVDPNAKVYQEYDYFRNTKQLNQYMLLWTDLIKNEFKYNRKYYLELKKELWGYKQYIDGAKYLVEDRGYPKEGLEVYSVISEKLDKFKAIC